MGADPVTALLHFSNTPLLHHSISALLYSFELAGETPALPRAHFQDQGFGQCRCSWRNSNVPTP